jgi:DNA polymerase lambda
MWYNNGCRTLDDIRARKGGIKLSPVQEIGLRFYDGALPVSLRSYRHVLLWSDINSRMPRSEAETIFNMIKPIGKSFCKSSATYRT